MTPEDIEKMKAIIEDFADQEPTDDIGCVYCLRKHVFDNLESIDLGDPANHAASCPWRRAKELIG